MFDGDDRAEPSAGPHQTRALQFGVRPVHRVDRDAQITGQGPDRWQLLAVHQAPGGDVPSQLRAHLFVDRGRRGQIDDESDRHSAARDRRSGARRPRHPGKLDRAGIERDEHRQPADPDTDVWTARPSRRRRPWPGRRESTGRRTSRSTAPRHSRMPWPRPAGAIAPPTSGAAPRRCPRRHRRASAGGAPAGSPADQCRDQDQPADRDPVREQRGDRLGDGHVAEELNADCSGGGWVTATPIRSPRDTRDRRPHPDPGHRPPSPGPAQPAAANTTRATPDDRRQGAAPDGRHPHRAALSGPAAFENRQQNDAASRDQRDLPGAGVAD